MNDNMRQFWSVFRWFLLAMYGIIVSAGAINAAFAFAKLAEVDPTVTPENIYAFFGGMNLVLTAIVVWRGIKRDNR